MPLSDFIGLRRMKTVRAHFVGRDYRHVESDLVLTVPLRHERRRVLRKEIYVAHKSMAEQHRSEGRKQGVKKGILLAHRETLLRQLVKRFATIPPEVQARIQATTDAEQLAEWLDRIVTAKTWDDMGIGPH